MLRLRIAVPFLGLLFLSHSAQAQPPRSVDWSKLPDPATQQFEDPYQVPRVLRAILEAPIDYGSTTSAWVEKVMATPLLELK